MQQTETTLDWRIPDDLALANRHHHLRYVNPAQDPPHPHHCHPAAPPGRHNSVHCLRFAQIHHHYRLQAAYCSFLLSHMNWQTLDTPVRSTTYERQHTPCTPRSSRSSRSSCIARRIVVSNLSTLQRPTSQQQQQQQQQQQHYHHHYHHHHHHPQQPPQGLQPKYCQEPYQKVHRQQLRTQIDGQKIISVRLKPAVRPPRPHMPPMQRISSPLDRSGQGIRAIVSDVVPPHTSVSSVQLLPQHSLQQVYEVKLSDSTTMLVTVPPLPSLKLMRAEQNMLLSEAVLISWLRQELLHSFPAPPSPPHTMRPSLPSPRHLPSTSSASPSSPSSPSSTLSASTATSPSTRAPERPSPVPSMTHPPKHRGVSGHRASLSAASVSSSAVLRADLLQYLPLPVSMTSPPPPILLDGSKAPIRSSSRPLAFNVTRPTSGTPVTALASPLTPAERIAVDYQAGKLIRQLSQLTPASGHFGPALAVLAPQSQAIPGLEDDLAVGMGCWSVAFHAILESILRDGEDVAVQLPYPTVRRHFRRLGHLLDIVTTPSLVVVDAMDDSNLLVERSSGRERPVSEAEEEDDSCSEKPESQPRGSASPTPATTPAERVPDDKEDTETAGKSLLPSPLPSTNESRSASSSPFSGEAANVVVTGFRDWSHCIFGDPLFASVFCNQPSMPFLRGFNSTDRDDDADVARNPLGPHATHEETEYKAVRLLLYQCYHAIVQIVRGFYHPGRDRTTQELAARKRLNEILVKLEAVDEDPKKRFRHRRPSGEMSPAKKPRSESGDDTPKR